MHIKSVRGKQAEKQPPNFHLEVTASAQAYSTKSDMFLSLQKIDSALETDDMLLYKPLKYIFTSVTFGLLEFSAPVFTFLVKK